MNPDLLLELAVHLVVSYVNGNDVVLGGRRWPAGDVRMILDSLDVYLLVCSNPDGRHYVMTVDDLWRKNRRDNPNTACDGVDLNRNLGFMWGVVEGQTSCAPCADTYAGPSAFSEPETRNVKHLLDTYRIEAFVDVHSYAELVLYPWGHATTQTTDPTERFTSLPTGTCQPIGVPGYREYLPPRDELRFRTVGQRIVDEIAAVRGRIYTGQPSVALYPTTGTHSDYAYSRHIADPQLRKVYGYTIETGPWAGTVADSFHPPDPEPVKREAESGLIAFLQQCICAIELIGWQLLQRDTEVGALRGVRDQMLGTTAAGREWIALFERVQTSFLGMVLTDGDLRRSAADLVATAGALAADDRNVLGPDVAEAALAFLGRLEDSSPTPELTADLRAVRARLEGAAGREVGAVLRTLMAEGPGHR
jgi:hypothetical protein